MSFQQTSAPYNKHQGAVAWSRETDAAERYRIVVAALLPAAAILLAAAAVMTKLMMA